MAITIEPKRGGNTYQGIVELSPDGIAASAETYFAQSEQLPTAIRLAAAPLFVAGDKTPRWRAGGLMLQMTPDAAKDKSRNEDDWARLSLLLKTVEDLELVDTALAPETVLWRLFHEDEVRVQPAEPIAFRCDCDASRIVQILKGYAPDERAGLADPDGIIRARCEFCGTMHEIGPEAAQVNLPLSSQSLARGARGPSDHNDCRRKVSAWITRTSRVMTVCVRRTPSRSLCAGTPRRLPTRSAQRIRPPDAPVRSSRGRRSPPECRISGNVPLRCHRRPHRPD